MWVKSRSRDWWDRLSHQSYPDASFQREFWMLRSTFEFLSDELGLAVAKEDTTLRAAFPIRQCLAVAVWWLATGELIQLISKRLGLGISTCHKLVLEVCSSIKTLLMPKFLFWQGPVEASSIAAWFEAVFGIPNVIGSTYTTHVPIISLKNNVAAYFNRHKTKRNQKTSIFVSV